MGRYAYDGPTVVIEARVALLLERYADLNGLRRAVRDRGDLEAYDQLNDLRAVALQWATDRLDALRGSPDGGTPLPKPGEPDGESGGMLSSVAIGTAKVANLAACTPRAVRKAAFAGRLQGVRDEQGNWTFTPGDVAAWLATRAAS